MPCLVQTRRIIQIRNTVCSPQVTKKWLLSDHARNSQPRGFSSSRAGGRYLHRWRAERRLLYLCCYSVMVSKRLSLHLSATVCATSALVLAVCIVACHKEEQ